MRKFECGCPEGRNGLWTNSIPDEVTDLDTYQGGWWLLIECQACGQTFKPVE